MRLWQTGGDPLGPLSVPPVLVGFVAWIESPDDVATLLIAGQGRILLERALAAFMIVGGDGALPGGLPRPREEVT